MINNNHFVSKRKYFLKMETVQMKHHSIMGNNVFIVIYRAIGIIKLKNVNHV